MSKIITYSEARNHLKEYLDYVVENSDPVFITRKNGEEAVLISKKDYEAMDETDYLLSMEANRENLMKSIKSKDFVEFESIDAFKKHYGL